MKNKHKSFRDLEYVAAGKKRYNFHFSFSKKDVAIRYIEIVAGCIVAFIVIYGLYKIA